MKESMRAKALGMIPALALFSAPHASAQEAMRYTAPNWAELGGLRGRYWAETRGFCPIESTIGRTQEDGSVILDPDIEALRAQGVPEQSIRSFVMGRGLACRRIRQGRDSGLTAETQRDRVEPVE